MDLNKAMIIGRLTRDPELRTTPSGLTVASFSLATNLVWTDQQGQKQERVEFHNIVAWRKLAEVIGQYLHKGSKVYIEGRLQTRDWVGQQDNIKRYRTEIIADNMIMLDRAGSTTGTNQAPPPQEKSSAQPNQTNEAVINVDDPVDENVEEDEIKVENIPF